MPNFILAITPGREHEQQELFNILVKAVIESALEKNPELMANLPPAKKPAKKKSGQPRTKAHLLDPPLPRNETV